MLGPAVAAASSHGLACEAGDGRRARFVLDGAPRCWTHTLRYWPMLRRSLLTAAVIGTLLTSINQGNVILRGDTPAELYWKVPLTYCVPFCVATWGALVNSRIRR
jgi:hypothetical protein